MQEKDVYINGDKELWEEKQKGERNEIQIRLREECENIQQY